jgi:hypothetical protein
MSSSVRARDIFSHTLGPMASKYNSTKKRSGESADPDQISASVHLLNSLIKSENETNECLRREESSQIHTFNIDRTSSKSSLLSIQTLYSETNGKLREISMDSRLFDQARQGIDCITASMIEELAKYSKTYEEKRSSAERNNSVILSRRRRLQALRCRAHEVEQELLSGKKRVDLVNDSYEQIILMLGNLKSRHVDSLHRLRAVIINHRVGVESTGTLQQRARTLHEDVEVGVAELRKFKERYVGKQDEYRSLEEALSRTSKGIEDLSRRVVDVANRNQVLVKSSDDVKCKLDKFGRILGDFREPVVVCSTDPNNTTLNSSSEWIMLVARSIHLREQQSALRNELARCKRLTPGKIIQISSENSKNQLSNFELHWRDRVSYSQVRDPPLSHVLEVITELLKLLRNVRDSVQTGIFAISGGGGHDPNSESEVASNCFSVPDHRSLVLKKSIVEAQIRFGLRSFGNKVTIRLSGFGLCGYDIPIIIGSLQRIDIGLERISVLDLSDNSFMDSDVGLLLELIKILPEMVCLDISRNGFTDAAKHSLDRRKS